MQMALEGVKVLDLTRVLAGPYAAMLLAEFGADVVKIESPKVGDDSRAYGPYQGGESAYFMSLNHDKKSIVLNLKQEEDIEVFKELVKRADVVVENYRPGTMEKLGLGYETLKELNPGIIYAATSGFGDSGPYRLKPAYDVVVQAMGGVMSITGPEGGMPHRVGASIGDITAGIFTAYGVALALFHRERTGVGQKIDVSMLDCQVAILENAIARYEVTGVAPGPIGNRHPSITPFASYKAADDRWVIVGCGNQKLWENFCNLVGRPELITDPRFIDNPTRTENVEDVTKVMNEIIGTKPMDEWLQILDDAGIPCAPISTMAEVVTDPQILSRDMIVPVEHPTAGTINVAGVPIKFSETPGAIKTAAPTLGQHTEEILTGLLGWDADRAAAFSAKNQ